TEIATDELFDDIGPLYDSPLSKSDQSVIAQLASAFGSERWNGDLDSTPLPVPPSVRSHVTTNAAGCLGRKCPYISQCPALRARKTAQDAQIVVVNHALLLAALSMDGEGQEQLLGAPEKMLLVVDEGHHRPSVAVQTGAASVAIGSAIKRLVKLPPGIARVFNVLESKSLGGFEASDVGEMVTAYSSDLKALKASIERAWTPQPGDREPTW